MCTGYARSIAGELRPGLLLLHLNPGCRCILVPGLTSDSVAKDPVLDFSPGRFPSEPARDVRAYATNGLHIRRRARQAIVFEGFWNWPAQGHAQCRPAEMGEAS
jgi:hypothetical protein